MLKRPDIVKGAVVEVLPVIKNGIEKSGFKDHILITAEAGSFLFGGNKGVRSGAILEIVDKPKRRGEGGTTVIVKVRGEDVQGHVFWCELRASCKLIAPAPTA
jgi:hypothetical protein